MTHPDQPTSLTASELAVRAELLSLEPTSDQITAAESVCDNSTGTLLVLAELHRRAGDEAGAALLRQLAERFADHEATVL